jgi:hypothetical protein
MARKIIRVGIVATLAGAALAAGLPAHAMQISPRITPGVEYVFTYYSNAQETTVIGERFFGSCGNYLTGTSSEYSTARSYLCPG